MEEGLLLARVQFLVLLSVVKLRLHEDLYLVRVLHISDCELVVGGSS